MRFTTAAITRVLWSGLLVGLTGVTDATLSAQSTVSAGAARVPESGDDEDDLDTGAGVRSTERAGGRTSLGPAPELHLIRDPDGMLRFAVDEVEGFGYALLIASLRRDIVAHGPGIPILLALPTVVAGGPIDENGDVGWTDHRFAPERIGSAPIFAQLVAVRADLRIGASAVLTVGGAPKSETR